MNNKDQKISWIQKQYSENETFQEQMKQAESRYNKTLQLALYTNLQKVEKLKIIQKIGKDQNNNIIFAIYGMFMPLNDSLNQKLYFLMINVLDQIVTNLQSKYILVFFNTLCTNYHSFSNFKNIIKSFPYKYFIKMDKIIIVHPTFSIKCIQWFSFGTINKILSRCIVYIDNIKQFSNLFINPHQILQKIPKQIKKMNRLSEEQIKNPSKIKGKQRIQPFIINVQKNSIIGIKLQKFEICEEGIPMVIKNLFLYFQIKPQKAKIQGIFRKNGDIEQQRQLQKRILQNDYDYLSHIEDPYIVCGLIKKIYNNMQDPLFDYEIYYEIIKYEAKDQNQQFIKNILKKLKPLNFRTLQFTLSYLVQKIIIYKQQNKMSNYNMAVVFSPCFFRPKQYKIQDLLHSAKFVLFIQKLLQNFTQFFGNKKNQQKIYRQSEQKAIKQYGNGVLNVIKEEFRKSSQSHSINIQEIVRFE